MFDSNLKEDVKRFNTIGCSRQTQQLLAKEADTPLDEIYADQLEKGTMVKADTIEELAVKLGFSGEAKDAFLAEVEKYNGFYDAQEDPDFGKEAYRLSRAAHGAVLRHLVRRLAADHRGRSAHQRGHAGAERREPAHRGSLRRGRLLRQHLREQLPRVHRGLRLRTHHHVRTPRRPPHGRRSVLAHPAARTSLPFEPFH